MRVPSLAFYTLLPVLAIANTAQASEDLPSTEPNLGGKDLAPDTQARTVTEIAAIPLTVEPAAPESLEFSEPEPLPTVSQEAVSLEPIPAKTMPEFAAIAPESPTPELPLEMEATAISDVQVVQEDVVAIAPEPAIEGELQQTFEPIELATSNAAALTAKGQPTVAAAPIPDELWEQMQSSEPNIAPTTMAKAEFADAEMMAVQPTKDCLKNESAQLISSLSATAIAQRANNCYEPQEIETVDAPKGRAYAASPALSIYIPVGYGADRNTGFVSTGYQSAVRPDADGSTVNAGLGVGLGNASKNVGVELSYALANNDNFGEGGFNVKVHRRLANDWAIAAGWNGLLNIGRNDFEHSKYGVVTKVVRLTPSLDDPLSRLSITAGIGDNQFRSNGAAKVGENNPNVFGNMALRVVRPVSLIAEWTGQDLGLGLSIAPFKRLPITITPAVRDLVTTDGRATRFVLGVGTAFRF